MDRADNRSDNPYTEWEGYTVIDASGEPVGRVEETVYDAVSDVLKYIVVDGRPIPAEDTRADPDEERITVPFDRRLVESAPPMQDFSGAFDEAVHEHYGEQA